jgi:hypothetical protein
MDLRAIGGSGAFFIYPTKSAGGSLDGTTTEVGGEEMEGLKTQCELWRSLEREAVGKILSPPQPAEPIPEIPAPENQ